MGIYISKTNLLLLILDFFLCDKLVITNRPTKKEVTIFIKDTTDAKASAPNIPPSTETAKKLVLVLVSKINIPKTIKIEIIFAVCDFRSAGDIKL